MFLCAKMPEGPQRPLCYGPKYFRTSEDAAAGNMLPRLQRASGQYPSELSAWQQCSFPLSLLALLHVIWRNPHHTHGQAHSIPFHTVWTNWQSTKVKGAQWLTDTVKWKEELSFLLQFLFLFLFFWPPAVQGLTKLYCNHKSYLWSSIPDRLVRLVLFG